MQDQNGKQKRIEMIIVVVALTVVLMLSLPYFLRLLYDAFIGYHIWGPEATTDATLERVVILFFAAVIFIVQIAAITGLKKVIKKLRSK